MAFRTLRKNDFVEVSKPCRIVLIDAAQNKATILIDSLEDVAVTPVQIPSYRPLRKGLPKTASAR